MENQTRFDLNAAVENWRQELATQANLTSEVRRELETHLRDAIAGFQQRGLTDEESFRLARERVGQMEQLGKEFKKASANHWNRSLAMTVCLFAFVTCIWAWSYHARHSLQYGWANGYVLVVADRGIVQIYLVGRDTKADAGRVPGFFYHPNIGFEERGFEWDAHRRYADTGRECLNMWKPKAGFAGFLADYGLASWSYHFGVGLVMVDGPSCLGRQIFMPFWLLALLVTLPALIKPVVVRAILFVRSFAVHGGTKSKESKTRLSSEQFLWTWGADPAPAHISPPKILDL
jgi:hypothetical protein